MIILLILAGVVLNLTLGERGIFNIAKKAGENYVNAQDKELADLEKLYSEIKIATGENSQITISMEDLNKIIESKVTPLQQKVQKLETELRQEINNVPRFIDTNSLITTITEQGASWTATEDCAVRSYIVVNNAATAIVYVDGVAINTLADVNSSETKITSATNVFYVKKGSVISTREGNGKYQINIYKLK